MEYILLYNMDQLSKKVLLESYIDEGFKIISNIDNMILIRKCNSIIQDEEIYIKILFSYLKRSEILKENKGKVIDLTSAFKYASSKQGYNKFDNKFEWYIKKIIVNEIISN